MADPVAPVAPVALTPDQVNANKKAHRDQEFRQLGNRMQAGLRSDGIAGLMSAFMGLPVFQRGNGQDGSAHGTYQGPGHYTDPNFGFGAYKYKLPYPAPAPAPVNTGADLPPVAPAAAAAPLAAPAAAPVAAPVGGLADTVVPQKKRASNNVFTPAKSSTRRVGGTNSGGFKF